MCALRDAAPSFSDLKINVYGISVDDVVSQADFAKENELKFPLLSDPDGSVAKKFGVLNVGRRGAMASRVTFIWDDKGVLRKIDREVSVQSHGADLAKIIAELKS